MGRDEYLAKFFDTMANRKATDMYPVQSSHDRFPQDQILRRVFSGAA